MDFAHPQFISSRPWVVLFALLVLGLAIQQYWAQRKAFTWSLSLRYGPALSPWRLGLKWGLWTAAAFFLLKALAVPLGEPVKVEGGSQGADVILAVDVSSSMYAQDVPPNRLMALKQGLSSFIGRLSGDRVGIVAFAGEAVIACPLTTDYDTATLFLEKLETDSVPRDGTGLAKALQLCLEGFSPDEKRGRLLVLASDGEDTLDSDAEEWARKAGQREIPIYTLAIGTLKGDMIPGRRDFFGQVYAKTYHGQPVITKLSPAAMKKIAALSQGQYFEGASPQAIAMAYERVRQLKQGMAKSPDRFVRDPLYQKPLLWAIVLLLLEMLLSNRSGGLSRAGLWLRKRALAFLAARSATAGLLLLLSSSLGALSLDPGRSEYDKGNQTYRQGDYAGAAGAYEQSLKEKPRAQTHYNLGNAKFMQEDYEGAIAAYDEALKLNPEDGDTSHNRDLAQRRLEQKKQGGQGKKQDQKQNQKQDQKGQQQQQSQGGQGGQGKQSQGQQGQGQGAKPGQKGQGQGGAAGLNEDQVRAMMNMLKNDQRRYGGAFNPMRKYQNKQQPQDPVEELFQQMTGRPVKPQQEQGGAERKEW